MLLQGIPVGYAQGFIKSLKDAFLLMSLESVYSTGL
jgi:hypothetical protein